MKAKRRDIVEPDLIKLAIKLGAWPTKIDEPCDWLVWYRGEWMLVEIKDPAKEGHADEFTPAQRAFRAEAFRRRAKLVVWRTDDDVLKSMNARRVA